MVRLHPERANFFNETDRLLVLIGSTFDIEPVHRKLIAEIVLLRLSILLEIQIQRIFAKICCCASYLDGSSPIVVNPLRSMTSALHAMATLNRPRPRYPIWNDGAEIRKNVEHLINVTDHCIGIMRTYAPHLTEIRYVRNHIAHRNDGTRKNYRSILRKYYGAFLPGITCGPLLLSNRVSKPPLLEVYIRTSRVLLNHYRLTPVGWAMC